MAAAAEGEPMTAYVELPSDVVEADVEEIKRRRKQNVQLMFLFSFSVTLMYSIVQWNIFDAYLSFLSKSLGMKYINSSVGVAESILGLTSLFLAVPIGCLVDAYSRSKILKASAFIGLFASAVSFYTFYYDAIVPLYCNLFVWGVFSQLSSTSSEAIFADSIPAGSRSALFTKKGVIEFMALSSGPGIMVGLFYFCGDTWSLKELHIPLLLGCLIAPIPCAILWFFKNPHPDIMLPASPAEPQQLSSPAQQVLLSSPVMSVDCPCSPFPEGSRSNDSESEDVRFAQMSTHERAIPYLVSFSDFVRKIGAGMTVKFFALFFINDYGFRPIHVNLLFCAYPASMAGASIVLQKMSRTLGRGQAALLAQFVAISLLLMMCVFRNVWLMVFLFLMRGAIQNATYPIDKSIITDYTPSKRRGIWTAVEQITNMTWSGSAVLGGILVDMHDYRFTFLITAAIYFVAAVVYAPLVVVVPKSEHEVSASSRRRAARSKVVPSEPDGIIMSDMDEDADPRSTDASDCGIMAITVEESEPASSGTSPMTSALTGGVVASSSRASGSGSAPETVARR